VVTQVVEKEKEGREEGQQSPASLLRRKKFFARLKGRCFNYFTSDHFRMQCRDPSKCWKCWRSGHILSRCSGTPHSRIPKHKSSKSVPQPCTFPLLFSTPRQPNLFMSTLECKRSFGAAPARSPATYQRVWRREIMELRGSAVNYPGNPQFWPRCAFEMADTTDEMEQRCCLLTS
jgi:hypothetical protein